VHIAPMTSPRSFELDAVAGVPQQQTASAHVATTDERRRKPEPLAEIPASTSTYLATRCCRAAPRRSPPDFRQQRPCARSSGRDTSRCPHRRSPRANARTAVCVTSVVGTPQPGVRRNHLHAGGRRFCFRGIGAAREPARVRQLAAKVQAADECEQIASGAPVRRP